MLDRRGFLKAAGAAALLPACTRAGFIAADPSPSAERGELVNDIHSQLNPTRVARIVRPASLEDVQAIVRQATKERRALSVAGGRHSMGAQQFGTDTVLLDTRSMKKVLAFDKETGIIEVEAGIQWPELISRYLEMQEGSTKQWGIAQKQTGADRLSIGGALASNVHGRGLNLKPFASDVESFRLVDAAGEVKTCSRTENSMLFSLATGGYGLFGIVHSVRLRLKPRRKLERKVEVIDRDQLAASFEKRIEAGYLYGDFQFSIDSSSDDFLKQGVFACYRPADDRAIAPQKELADSDWIGLLELAHTRPAEAFQRYAGYYLSTDGQVYWSDTQQLGFYPDDYHRGLDARLGMPPSTEIISELYVPRAQIGPFLKEVGEDFKANGVRVIYGTVRLIEKDDDSFLPWARERYACMVVNLHTTHTPEGIEHSASAFRRLIDLASKRGGSYFLTYHKFATKEQVAACYPRFTEFLAAKERYDPRGRFQSDWWRHHKKLFA